MATQVTGYLVNTVSGVMMGVNSTGLWIARRHAAGESPEAISQAYATENALPLTEDITSNVGKFVLQIQAKGFLPGKTRVIEIKGKVPPVFIVQQSTYMSRRKTFRPVKSL